jgi:two-component system sensor histidine kinase MprB
VIGLFVADALGRPLRTLSRTAEHIASTGDLSSSSDLEAEINTARSDETGILARSFVAMLSTLRRGQRQQQRLVQDVSHELRTPLTSLQANVDLLTTYYSNLSEGDRRAILSDLRGEMGELTTLITEIVEVATDGQSTETISTFELSTSITEITDRYRQRSGRTITVLPSTAGIFVVSARQRSIERCISNLLDNAIKFSPPSSEIRVELTEERLSVSNQSIPIPQEDLPHIFDRFYRSASSWSITGSGLGLAIVNDIVVSHGGVTFARNRTADGVNYVQVGFHLPGISYHHDLGPIST